MTTLTQAHLKEILHLDLKTGVWTWLIQPNGRVPIGSIAGTPKRRGNLEIKIEGKLHQASRLAWFYVHGHWPEDEIDHKNVNPADNRKRNLRKATHSQNAANRRKLAGKILNAPKGVSYHKGAGKFQAQIKKDQRSIYLGLFDTAEEASAAYFAAAKKLFGRFARSE
jgi:hypothetical protein